MNIFDKKLSVIIPAYNEGERIYKNLLKIDDMIASFSNNYELIPVNDGSKDNTKDEIAKASLERARILPAGYDKNRGKGGAIKEGVNYATGDIIAFLDADLDLSPMHLKDFMIKMDKTEATAVIGSKMHKDSDVDYPMARRIMSVGYYIMLKLMFRLNIKDTQTGVKLFKAEELKRAMTYVKSNGFAYDIEILALINVFGGKIVEMPVRIIFQRGTNWGRIKMRDIADVAVETMHIYNNIHKVKRMNNRRENIKK